MANPRTDFLKSIDVLKGPLTFQVQQASRQTFKRKDAPTKVERCVVLTLAGDPPRRLSLNQINERTLTESWGPDPADWVGQVFDAYFAKNVRDPNGKLVGGLRVRVREVPGAVTRVIATATEAADDLDF